MNEKKELNFQSPEAIANELLNVEKQMAEETLRVIRQRAIREKEQWNKIFESKAVEMLQLKNQLSIAESKIRELYKKLEQERENAIDRIKTQTINAENQKRLQQKKWNIVEEEIKKYRQEAEASRAQFLELQNQFIEFKEKAQKNEEQLREAISRKEDEILELKEKMLAMEQNFMKEKHQLQENITALEQKSSRLESTLSDEKLYQEKIIQKKEEELKNLKESLLGKIETITQIEEKRLEEEQKRIQAEEKLHQIEMDYQKLRQNLEEERAAWRKRWDEEQSSWEKIKQDYSNREEAIKSETESQIKRIMDTLSVIEKQLSEEKTARLDAEQKNIELIKENENLQTKLQELSAQWQRSFSDEISSIKKRYDEILTEYEQNRRAREGEIVRLNNELLNLKASLSENQRLYEIEKNENHQKSEKIKVLEESLEKLNIAISQKEEQWKKLAADEYERLTAQNKADIERLTSLLASRDNELAQLQDRLSEANALLIKTRQEHSASLNLLSSKEYLISQINAELESRKKELLDKYNTWQKTFQNAQSQWNEEKNKLLMEFRTSDEKKAQEIENLKASIEKLNSTIAEKSVAENELKHRLYCLELERNSEIQRHNTEIELKQKEIERLNSELQNLIGNYNQLFEDREKKNTQNIELQNQIIRLEEEKKRLSAEALNYQYQRDELTGILNKKMQDFLNEKNELISQFDVEKEKIVKEFAHKQVELEKKIASVTYEKETVVQEKDRYINQLKTELEVYKNNLAKETNDRKALEVTVAQLRDRIKNFENEIAVSRENFAQQNANLKNFYEKEIAELTNVKSSIESEKNKLLSEITAYKNKIHSMELEFAEEKGRFENEIKELQKKLSGINELEKKRQQLLEDWQKEREQWQKTIEAERQEFETRLSREEAKWAELLIVKNSQIEKLSDAIGVLKADISHLNDTVKDKDRIISDLNDELKKEQHISQKLHSDSEKTKTELKNANARIESLSEKISVLATEISLAARRKKECEEIIKTSNSEIERLKSLLKKERDNSELHKKKLIEEFENKIRQKEEQSNALIRGLEKRIAEIEKALSEKQDEIYEQKNAIYLKSEEIKKMKKDISALESDKRELQILVEKYRAENDSLKRQNVELNSNLHQAIAKNIETQNELKSAIFKVYELEKLCNEKNKIEPQGQKFSKESEIKPSPKEKHKIKKRK